MYVNSAFSIYFMLNLNTPSISITEAGMGKLKCNTVECNVQSQNIAWLVLYMNLRFYDHQTVLEVY